MSHAIPIRRMRLNATLARADESNLHELDLAGHFLSNCRGEKQRGMIRIAAPRAALTSFIQVATLCCIDRRFQGQARDTRGALCA